MALLLALIALLLAGHLALAVMTELRHRDLDRHPAAEVLLTALRIHEVAWQTEKAMKAAAKRKKKGRR